MFRTASRFQHMLVLLYGKGSRGFQRLCRAGIHLFPIIVAYPSYLEVDKFGCPSARGSGYLVFLYVLTPILSLVLSDCCEYSPSTHKYGRQRFPYSESRPLF